MRAARTGFLVLLLLFGLQVVLHYPRLPDSVASHFDGAGRSNGFQSRSMFLAFHAGAIVLVTAIFLLLPALLHRIPPGLINMPRRDYWLAPERRESSIALMAMLLTWFGVATLALLTVVMELVLRANLPGGSGRLSPVLMWALLGAYFLFVAGWLALVFARFLGAPR
jgi:serine/threonine-protein kinase